MNDLNDVLEIFSFYAGRISFSQEPDYNHFQYKMLQNDLRTIGVDLSEVSPLSINSSIHGLATERMRVYYLIKCVSDKKIRGELRRIHDQLKIYCDTKPVNFNSSSWGFVPL